MQNSKRLLTCNNHKILMLIIIDINLFKRIIQYTLYIQFRP